MTTVNSPPNLNSFLAERYPIVKTNYPDQGRLKWRLRVAEEYWKLSREEKDRIMSIDTGVDEESAVFSVDEDPSDEVAGEDAPGLGIVIRTDFSNEDAWQYFAGKLQEGEAEFSTDSSPMEEDAMDQDPTASSDTQNIPSSSSSSAPNPEEDDDEDDQDTSAKTPIFTVINPAPDSPLRSHLTDSSNLSVLRLFNDVNVRRAPPLPPDTKRHKPANRFIDHDGWQEIYEGKMLWIYDTKSNVDGCVRVVSQAGASYGTATADSWRARVTHICELQVNLATGAMSIDFGGLDRYDYEQRVTNLREAEQGIA